LLSFVIGMPGALVALPAAVGLVVTVTGRAPVAPGERVRTGARSRHASAASADDGENVAGGEDQELLAAVLDLGAAVLAVDDAVADVDVERDAVALVVDAAGANCEDLALRGFSFAVSGMTRPDAVVCSASRLLMTMRSSSGLMETDTVCSSPVG